MRLKKERETGKNNEMLKCCRFTVCFCFFTLCPQRIIWYQVPGARADASESSKIHTTVYYKRIIAWERVTSGSHVDDSSHTPLHLGVDRLQLKGPGKTFYSRILDELLQTMHVDCSDKQAGHRDIGKNVRKDLQCSPCSAAHRLYIFLTNNEHTVSR